MSTLKADMEAAKQQLTGAASKNAGANTLVNANNNEGYHAKIQALQSELSLSLVLVWLQKNQLQQYKGGC